MVWLIAGVSISAPLAEPGANPDREEAQQQYRLRLTATRTAYFKVVASNDPAADAEAHAALAEMERAYPGDAVATAYRGSLELLDVAHSWAVWNLHRQAADGLSLLDRAVTEAPNEPEARFIRAATDWHLPGFYHRRAQCEEDFAWLAVRAEQDARNGKMPLELAAATYNYWGQILVNRGDPDGARKAFETALRVAPQSPGGVDAGKRLVRLR
jgi:tetratricopeptide (TPR) repeat protein